MANPLADEKKFKKELAEQVGTNKDLKNLIFKVEMVIFKELQE